MTMYTSSEYYLNYLNFECWLLFHLLYLNINKES